MIRQLVTIKGKNIPKEACRSGNQALMRSSNVVTVDAMINTYIGILIELSSNGLSSDVEQLATTSVISVAIPNPIPLMALLLTARSGHRPSNLTSAGFSDHKPSSHVLRLSVLSNFSFISQRLDLGYSQTT